MNPTVAEWKAIERANGGQVGMTGRIASSEITASPDAYKDGSLWATTIRENGETMFVGTLKTPAHIGGAVDLAADGPAARADREVDRLLFQSRSYADWVPADSAPHRYDQNKHFDVTIRGARISFRGRPDHTYSGGELAGVVFWAPDNRITRIAFTVVKSDNTTKWELVLHGVNTDDDGVGAALTTITTLPLDSADPTEIDHSIAANYDCIRLALRKVGAGTPNDPPRVAVRDMRVNALAPDDDFTASDVVRVICNRLNVSDALVQETGVPALPFDLRDSTYADALDIMAIFAGWRWLFYTRNRETVCDFGPYSTRTWVLTDPESPVDLLPEPRYSRAVVNHRWADGIVIGQVEATADPNILGEIRTAPAFNLELHDSEETAETVAQMLADYLVTERWTGSVMFARVQDDSGTYWHHSQVRAGDRLYVPQVNAYLNIDELERTEAYATATFATGVPLLDRFNARRSRRRALSGRG